MATEDEARTGGPGYPGFPGHVGRTFAGSDGWWPPRPEPPTGAPNVVVMLVDDLGLADVGCYGSEIATPHLDALAARGLRFRDFHSTPMCSPTRAALLTGCNPHAVGVGTVAHSDAGFPGYAMELADDAVTAAEVFRANGYSTFMVGKWHLSKDSDQSAAGPRHSWPLQKGFDRFYGFLDAFTNLHQPHRLVEDNHAVEVDTYPDDYYLTDDLTDRAIAMIRETKASDPTKPFFLYFAHGAVHAPLQAKADDIARYRGRYEAGWDALRDERYARQAELGVIPEGAVMAPRNAEPDNDVPAWDDLSADEQALFARHMEVYAGMVDSIDQNLGRLVEALVDLGVFEDTIIIFTSDNGASREGEATGTSAYYVHLLQGDDLDADLARIDLLGGPQTTPHYPRGWAMAGNTPYRLYKINTHRGGHSVPFVVSWPAGLDESLGGGIRPQYTHVTDVLPTLIDVIGLDRPTERAGRPARPFDGTSFAPVLRDPAAPATRTEQVYEMIGHRGFYRDGWEIVTLHRPLTPFSDEEWELYDLRTDPTELVDLAAEHPERVRELAEAWEAAAWANQIYPLDEGSQVKYLIRPARSDVYKQPVRVPLGTPTLERWRSVQLIWFRACTMAVELDYRAGEQGVLFAHGDQGSGYALYVLDGELVYAHNDGRGRVRTLSGGPVPDGTRSIVCGKTAPGGNVWDVTLSVDGELRGTLAGVPMLYGMAPFEGITVGRDPRSPVSWELYERFGSFAWSAADGGPASLRAVTFTPGPSAPDAPDALFDMLRDMGRAFE